MTLEQPAVPEYSVLSQRPLSSPGARSADEPGGHPVDVIHERVLQPIGAAMIRIDLARRSCESGDGQGALQDLDIAADQLRLAATALRRVMDGLTRPRAV